MMHGERFCMCFVRALEASQSTIKTSFVGSFPSLRILAIALSMLDLAVAVSFSKSASFCRLSSRKSEIDGVGITVGNWKSLPPDRRMMPFRMPMQYQRGLYSRSIFAMVIIYSQIFTICGGFNLCQRAPASPQSHR